MIRRSIFIDFIISITKAAGTVPYYVVLLVFGPRGNAGKQQAAKREQDDDNSLFHAKDSLPFLIRYMASMPNYSMLSPIAQEKTFIRRKFCETG